MSLRLRNQSNPKKTLSLSNEAWFNLLNLAEEYGWNPMGTLQPEWWYEMEPPREGYCPENWLESCAGDQCRLVVLEDALNLADALERAFLEYEPEPCLKIVDDFLKGRVEPVSTTHPGVGVVEALADFCQFGAFWIERHT